MVRIPRSLRIGLGTLFAGLVASAPAAYGLLNIDGTRNQLFVFGSLAYGYNSNIFATAGGAGDYSLTTQIGAELKRKAGVIGIDCTAKIDFIRYGQYTDENAENPNFSLSLEKGSGRTTGSFSLQAYRETRSDYAVNLRTTSWNYPMALSLRYPLDDKFNLGSTTSYLHRSYEEEEGLVDYTDLSEDLDLRYAYTSKLDLMGGYRIRLSDTSATGNTLDQWLYVGATGGLFSKLTGTVRLGYQFRDIQNTPDGRYDNISMEASIAWPITRKLALSFSAVRDFNTIATGDSVDATSANARATYSYNRKFEAWTGVSSGYNHFLDPAQDGRRDTFFSWDVGASYKLNEHFNFGVTYTYFNNWSSLAIGDFVNQGLTFDISARF